MERGGGPLVATTMPSSPSEPLRCISVLVADDSAVARAALARKLRARGFEVTEHGSAALPGNRVVAEVGCAVLDLDLGDGDGRDLARALRRSRPDLPVAFFSTTSAADVLADARALGPVFLKPAELDDAVAWVEQTAAKRG